MAIFDAFRIRDRLSCERAIRRGAILALIIAAAEALLARMSFKGYADEILEPGLAPWISFDAAFVFITGLLVFRKSRIAATALLIYYVVGAVMLLREPNVPKLSYFFTLLFLAIFFIAMSATYIWHASYKK